MLTSARGPKRSGRANDEGEARPAGRIATRVRLRTLALVAAAVTGLLGPAGVANAAIGDAGPEDPGSTPAQTTSSTADAATANDAGVEQVAGQTQLGGTAEQPQQTDASPGQSDVQHGQGAKVGQQADADADAKLNHPENENASARVGASAAGDDHGASQKNSGNADASASTSVGVGQQADHPGNAHSEHAASGDQSANASARADVDRPANGNVTARIEAPGHNKDFDQSNEANATSDANADASGVDAEQQVSADATATLANPSNTAVELRVESDGDSDGGTQSNTATADAAVTSDDPDAAASASADATITNPANTFVSVRVNSDGTTGDVDQHNTTSESETVNGVTAVETTTDHEDDEWTSSDPASGVDVTLRSDGENTDVRVDVENDSLPLPSSAPTFVWTWDMAFGPGAPVSCDISSSVTPEQVTWTFDCDPNDLITRTGETAQGSTGTVTWTWSWDRPELPGWSWDRADVLPMALATCNCSYVIDFRWISFEPTAPAAPQPAAVQAESATPAVSQSNEASASAVATAVASVQQSLIQSGEDTSDRAQSLLQDAEILQIVSAEASSQLTDALNESEGALSVSQVNSVSSQAAQDARAEVFQSAAQTQLGTGSTQVQVAIQSASTKQRVSAIAVGISAKAVNSAAGFGAAKQSVTAKSAANGHASALTRQVLEQAQQGDGSEQQQLAGQWTTIAQDQRLVAATGLSRAVNETRLAGDGVAQDTFGGTTSRGSSTAVVLQAVVQVQVGDSVAQQQESYQVVEIEQDGEALAAATAGGTHRYVTPPPSSTNEEPAAARAPAGSLPVFSVGSRSVTSPATGGPIKPRTALPRRARHVVASATHASPRRAAHLTKVSASRAGSTGTALKRARDAGGATSGSPRRRGTAPQSIGASTFGSSGAGTGGAHGALSRYVLLWAPGPSRRVVSPAGRRPAAVRFDRKRPG